MPIFCTLSTSLLPIFHKIKAFGKCTVRVPRFTYTVLIHHNFMLFYVFNEWLKHLHDRNLCHVSLPRQCIYIHISPTQNYSYFADTWIKIFHLVRHHSSYTCSRTCLYYQLKSIPVRPDYCRLIFMQLNQC